MTLREAWKDLKIGTQARSVSHSTQRDYVFIGWAAHYAVFCEIVDQEWPNNIQPMIYRVSTVETAQKVFPGLWAEQ